MKGREAGVQGKGGATQGKLGSQSRGQGGGAAAARTAYVIKRRAPPPVGGQRGWRISGGTF